MNYNIIIKNIKLLSDPKNVEGMARYGINPEMNYGVSIRDLRLMAGDIGTNHELALRLWASGIRDARLLATLVADPNKLTESQAEEMVSGIDSWDICDGFCMNLVRHASFARTKAREWSGRKEEFVKRAGFSLMATLAVHAKKSPDSDFEALLPLIIREASDDRNYVKKSVNWALRSIGKRNIALNKASLRVARELSQSTSTSARWIGRDAVRELESEAVIKKISRKR